MVMKRLATCIAFVVCTAQAKADMLILNAGNNPFLPALASLVNKSIDTNGPIYLTVEKCGVINASWDNVNTLTICQEVLDSANQQAVAFLKRGVVTESAATKMAIGSTYYVALHELAHALIQRHRIPYTGRQEDVADEFAMLILLSINDRDVYAGALNFFSQMEKTESKKRISNFDLSNEHSLWAQRKYDMLCWAYGRNPELMEQIALGSGMSKNRLNRCPQEYADMKSNVSRIFSVIFLKN